MESSFPASESSLSSESLEAVSSSLSAGEETGHTRELEAVRACLTGDRTLLASYIAGGGTVDYRHSDGNALIHFACRRSNIEIVRMLLEQGANPNLLTKHTSVSPLHLAAGNGSVALLTLLLDSGADICLGKNNETPLTHAVTKGHIAASVLLIRRGDDPFLSNSNGRTPLAAMQSHANRKDFLLGCTQVPSLKLASAWLEYRTPDGSDIPLEEWNACDQEGNTPILNYVRHANNAFANQGMSTWHAVVNQLLAKGVNSKAVNFMKQSVISLTERAGNLELLLVIMSHLTVKGRTDVSGVCLSSISSLMVSAFKEVKTKILDISRNELQRVPPELATLEHLEKLKLQGNPLSVLPGPVRQLPWPRMKAYLQSITERAEKWNERKVIIVGEEGVGKSTLVRSLCSRKGKASCKENLATDGVSITPNISLTHGLEQPQSAPGAVSMDTSLLAWDLGGQEVFYPTHQFFLTANCVYFVVFDISSPGISRIEYWMRQIKSLSRNDGVATSQARHTDAQRGSRIGSRGGPSLTNETTVYLIGTHADADCCTPEYVEEALQTVKSLFRKSTFSALECVLAVSCKTGSGIQALRNKLLDHIERKPITIPTSWVVLHDHLCDARYEAQRQWILWPEFSSIATNCGIRSSSEIRNVAAFLHNSGSIVHFFNTKKLTAAPSARIHGGLGPDDAEDSGMVADEDEEPREERFSDSFPGINLRTLSHRPDDLADSADTSENPAAFPGVKVRTMSHRPGELGSARDLPLSTLSSHSSPAAARLDLASSCDSTGSLDGTSHDEDHELIVLDPQWLSSVMTCIISIKGSWVRQGILKLNLLPKVLAIFPTSIHEAILQLLEQFRIVHRLRNETVLVPSLLPLYDPGQEDQSLWPLSSRDYAELGRMIEFPHLPLGFFERLQVQVLHIPQLKVLKMWKDAFIVELVGSSDPFNISSKTQGEAKFLKKYWDGLGRFSNRALIVHDIEKHAFFVKIRSNKRSYRAKQRTVLSHVGALLRLILEAINTYIDGFNMQYSVERFVMCTHCIQGGAKSPFLFTYAEVIEAIQEGKGVLFCQHIKSPSRCVNVAHLAPDLAFADIPKLFNKDLRRTKLIGQGGSGMVYAGVLTLRDGTEANVAVKELTSSPNADKLEEEASFIEFQQEVFIMSTLNSDYLVRFYGIVRQPLQMVLELVPKGDLFEFLHPKIKEDHPDFDPKKENRLEVAPEAVPWRLRLLIALDVAIGMRHLHSITPPVIHRDLRTPNIFLSSLSEDPSTIRAKVADFGLSRLAGGQISGALATWQWLAPEVIGGASSMDTYDERSDIYSFGICCWELITRGYPFEEYASDPDYNMKDGKGRLQVDKNLALPAVCAPTIMLRPTWKEKDDGCPDAFVELVERCWSAAVSDRPPFTEIVERLCMMLDIDDPSIVEEEVEVASNQPRPMLGSVPAHQSAPSGVTLRDDRRKRRVKLQHRSLRQGVKFCSLAQSQFSGKLAGRRNQPTSLGAVDSVFWIGCADGTISAFDGRLRLLRFWKSHRGAVSGILMAGDNVWTLGGDAIRVWRFNYTRKIAFLDVTMNPLLNARGAAMCVVEGSASSVWLVEQCDSGRALVHIMDATSFKETATIELDMTMQDVASPGAEAAVAPAAVHFPQAVIVPHMDHVWVSVGKKVAVIDRGEQRVHAYLNAHDHDITAMFSGAESGPFTSEIRKQIWTGDASGLLSRWVTDENGISLHSKTSVHCSSGPIRDIGYCGDHVWTAAGSTVILWEVDSKEPVEEVSTNSEALVAMKSFSSGMVTVSSDRGIRFWEVAKMANQRVSGRSMKLRTRDAIGLPQSSARDPSDRARKPVGKSLSDVSLLTSEVEPAIAQPKTTDEEPKTTPKDPNPVMEELKRVPSPSWGESARSMPITKVRSNTVIGRRSSDSTLSEENSPKSERLHELERIDTERIDTDEEANSFFSLRPPRKSGHIIGRRNSVAGLLQPKKKG